MKPFAEENFTLLLKLLKLILHIHIPCILVFCGIRLPECGLFKKCLASMTHNTLWQWVKQSSLMYKTLTYFNFEAFDINFDMVLYYMYFYVTSFINISNQYAM